MEPVAGVEAFSPEPPKIDVLEVGVPEVSAKDELPIDDDALVVPPKIELEAVVVGTLPKIGLSEELTAPNNGPDPAAKGFFISNVLSALVEVGVVVDLPPKMELVAAAGVEEPPKTELDAVDANKGLELAWVAPPSVFITGSDVPNKGAFVAAVVEVVLVKVVARAELSFLSPLPNKVELATAALVPAPKIEVGTLVSFPKAGPFAKVPKAEVPPKGVGTADVGAVLLGSGVLSLNSEGLDTGVTGSVLFVILTSSVLVVTCGVVSFAALGLNNGVIWRWGVGVGLPNPNFGLAKVDEGTEPNAAPEKAVPEPVEGEAKPPANDDDL